MMQLHTERISFIGGDCLDAFSRLVEHSSKTPFESSYAADSELFHSSLIGSYPRIFPKWKEVPTSSDSVILLNVPLSDGLRAQCVYFKKSLGRAFWNVLCFTYRADALSTADATSLLNDNADVWYDVVCRLDKGEPDLTLPRMLMPPSWDAQSVYAISFLTAAGKLKNGSYNEDWHQWLPPAASPSVPLLKPELPTSVPPVCNSSPKGFRSGVVVGVVVGMAIGMAIGMAVGMNVKSHRPKSFPPFDVKHKPISEPPNPPVCRPPEPPPLPPITEPQPDRPENGTSEDEALHDESPSSVSTSAEDNAEQGMDSIDAIAETSPSQPVDATNQVSITDENPPVHEQEEKDSQQQPEE